ncbi:hypothetical protein PAXRUDRAFT_830945 [Paxillus rubicundulus Ve08.2h10]|uniref:Unplaced genomic scaffold scaffold_578, whole genome shotgun sequence n=1 Tax=Paxillus rubicundulus Ve08.2h10 TaxID=930991 RepID=A0A0D0E321_9AGAM|nr:hypothetical protein PAXRUDRAFT_830945 [Paxillus rubicundulus Ve08.2h10]
MPGSRSIKLPEFVATRSCGLPLDFYLLACATSMVEHPTIHNAVVVEVSSKRDFSTLLEG